jgi:DNA-binding transcriptional MocR family regulator
MIRQNYTAEERGVGPTTWSEQLSQGAQAISSSAIRDLLKVTELPDIISFAGGLPAPESFPTEELAAAAERILVERPVAALQYGPTEGPGAWSGLGFRFPGSRLS